MCYDMFVIAGGYVYIHVTVVMVVTGAKVTDTKLIESIEGYI